MRASSRIRLALIVFFMIGCLTTTALAEVAAQPKNNNRTDTLVVADVGITDGVDPIPQIWGKVRQVPDDWVLNAAGAARGDGRPDIAYQPNTRFPVVVWSYKQPDGNFDVAISFWQGSSWSPIEFVADTPEDELDPRVYVRKNGTVHVVWWVDAADQRVMLSTHSVDEVGSAWPSLRISPLTQTGRRPSVAVFGGVAFVAYERDSSNETFQSQEVTIWRVHQGGPMLEHVADADWDAPLDAMLHIGFDAGGECLYMDYKKSATEFGYLKLGNQDWTAVNTEAWNDASWVGEENTRRAIASQVYGMPTVPPTGP